MLSKAYKTRLSRGAMNQVVWGLRSLSDPGFYLFLSLSLASWFIPQLGDRLSLEWLATKALIEELFFRFLLQEAGERLLKHRQVVGPISLANILVSATFSSMHMFRQPVFWAIMTFFPSLVFGLAWNRYKSVLSTSLIHFFYNFALFYRVF